MKIAIHDRAGSFSDRWIEYCDTKCIQYKLINCFANDIVAQLEDYDCLLWHWNHLDDASLKFARHIIFALEARGIAVFPNLYTCQHFNDKVAQKYLLESLEIPHIASFVFYDKVLALNWIERASFPKVFKLRGGAGSMNVVLVSSKHEARKIVAQIFKKGFSAINERSVFKDSVAAFRRHKSLATFVNLAKRFVRLFVPRKYQRVAAKERGYIYFQDFIPENTFDIRIIVIGNKAFGIKRMCREGDFRASGSGLLVYDQDMIDIRCVKLAFEAAEKLRSQCMAFDFVFNKGGEPLIVEMSYAFAMKGYDDCKGFWDKTLCWQPGVFSPQYWMIENLIEESLNRL